MYKKEQNLKRQPKGRVNYFYEISGVSPAFPTTFFRNFELRFHKAHAKLVLSNYNRIAITGNNTFFTAT